MEDQFLTLLHREFDLSPWNVNTIVDYLWIRRFIEADVENALENARYALRWRIANKEELYRVRQTRTCMKSYDVRLHCKCDFHGNNLVFYVGQSALRKVNLTYHELYHVLLMTVEYGFRLCDTEQRATGTRIMLNPIFDFTGFSYRNASFMWVRALRAVHSESLRLYPGLLSKAQYVNPPKLVKLFC